MVAIPVSRACERGVQGVHCTRARVQGGPEELRLSRQVLDQIFVSLALHPSPILGKKIGPNLSENLFFFVLHLILGKKIGPNLSEDLF